MTAAVNLLPPEIFEKRKAERLMIYLILGFVLLIVVLLAVYGLTWLRVLQVKDQVSELDLKTQKLKIKVDKPVYKQAEQKKAELGQREGVVNQAMAGEIKWHIVFNEVSMLIPSDVWLISFDGSATEIKCKGYTFEHPSVAMWLDRLTGIQEWTNLWLSYSQKTDLEGQEVTEFETTARFGGAPQAAAGTSTSPQSKGNEGK